MEVPSPPDVPSKFSVYRAFGLRIVRAVLEHKDTYQMPWHSVERPLPLPVNAFSKEAYRGANIIALWAEATAKGYASAVWGTYSDWQNLEAQVRRGERGTLVVSFQRAEPAGPQTELDLLPRYLCRAQWVFNASQVEHFAPAEAPARDRMEIHDDVDSFIRAIDARIFRHPFKAYYDSALDNIYMVDPTMFLGSRYRSATEAYYAVLLQELARWTGAKHRLNRDTGLRFRDKAQAFEILVTELAAAFMCSAFGITNQPRPENAEYVLAWLDVLSEDGRAIFTAANYAQETIQLLGELAAARLEQPQERVA
jgi:antirestriction protein ArdC